MSIKFSNSPALHLTLGRSRVRCVLHGLLCLVTSFGLYRLYQRGYPVPALLLAVPAAACCWQLARTHLVGASLCWHRGHWTLRWAGSSKGITLLPRSACLPWVIYLAWLEEESGRPGSLWLFPDSAGSGELRELRVRLALQR